VRGESFGPRSRRSPPRPASTWSSRARICSCGPGAATMAVFRASGAPGGHVGRRLLEGLGQARCERRETGLRRKLRQLPGLRLVAGAEQLLELAQGAAGADRPEATPGAPNATRATRSMLALHGGRNLVETASLGENGACRLASFNDRSTATVSESAQNSGRRRGPGGISPVWKAGLAACQSRNGGDGRRAGVNALAGQSRPHEAGEFAKLRRAVGGCQAAGARCCGKRGMSGQAGKLQGA
jgi:hypothetical protein